MFLNPDRRRLLLLLAVQCAAAAALIAVPEIAARRASARRPQLLTPSGARHPPFFNNPGVTASANLWAPIEFRHESHGLRGPEVPLAKGSARRILILGDSVVYGLTVGEDETVSAQLERMLNGPSGRKRWEVLNAGVTGYDSWDYEGWLKLKGLAFKPDIVVVGLYMNDHISRDVWEETTVNAAAPKAPLIARLRTSLLSNSELLKAFYYYIQHKQGLKNPLYARPKPLSPEDDKAISAFFPGDLRTAAAVKLYLRQYRYRPFIVKDTLPWVLDVPRWDLIRGPLGGIRDVCRARGMRFLVEVFPVQFEVFPGYRWPEPHRKIGEILRSLGIPFVDLQPIFQGTGWGDELYKYRYDYAHPGREGYALAAQALLDKLTALGWLGEVKGKGL